MLVIVLKVLSLTHMLEVSVVATKEIIFTCSCLSRGLPKSHHPQTFYSLLVTRPPS